MEESLKRAEVGMVEMPKFSLSSQGKRTSFKLQKASGSEITPRKSGTSRALHRSNHRRHAERTPKIPIPLPLVQGIRTEAAVALARQSARGGPELSPKSDAIF